MNIYGYARNLYSDFIKKKRKRYIDSLVNRGLKMGRNVDIIENAFFDPSHCFLISIGDNCTICPNVRLIAHDASTKKILGFTKLGRIIINDRCFIGDSVIVLPGVTIGPDSIVGAGSVVTHDVPPGTVVAGNPAKMISLLGDYLIKIEAISKSKKIYSEEYYIDKLDERKRQEMLQSIGKTVGFII
jgi:maltose O-acetyltransferase